MTYKTKILTEDQFAKSLIQRLDSPAQNLSHNVTERLRFARERALGAQKLIQTAIAPVWQTQVQANGALAMRGGFFGKWASLLPLVALVAGLFVIEQLQNDSRASEVAALDAALLTDDLPPAAYADQGFGQFLKLQLKQAEQ
jgi:hypothetical protein